MLKSLPIPSAFVDSAMDAVIVVDADQRIAMFNPAAEAMFGHAAETVLGKPLGLLMPARFRDSHGQQVRRFGENGTTNRTEGRLGEVVGLRVNGEEFPIEVAISHGRVGDEEFYVAIVRDLTERKRVEEELRQSNERLRAIIQASPHAIIALSPEGIAESWNPAAERIFGWKEEEVLGHPLPFVDPADKEEHRRLRETVLGGGSLVNQEVQRKRKDGSAIIALLSAVPLRDAEGRINGILSALTDVTQEREMAAQLRQTEQLAVLGRVSAYIAHQLSTPLTNISLLASAMEHSETRPEVLTRLAKLKAQASTAADIISDLMRFSKERVVLKTESDLNEIIRHAMDQVAAVRRPGVAFEVHLPGRPVLVQADPMQIREVFVNLLKNAFEATSLGSVTVRLREVDESWEASVIDTGNGMAPDILNRLFEPFFTTKGSGRGNGLGLSYCRTVLTAHGGRLEVESEVGHGSTFRVVLPKGDDPGRRGP